jgi:hypothetical protein
MKKFKNLLLMGLMLSVCINACKPDEPEDQNEEEVITTMNLYFTDTASKQTTKMVGKP